MPHADFDFLPIYARDTVSRLYRENLAWTEQQLDAAIAEAASRHGVAHDPNATAIAHRWLMRRCHEYTKANTPTMTVYVPVTDEATFIARGSAIVAKSEPDATGRVVVWYEGNLYGAENLKRFDERVLCAAGRAATSYPTAAIASFSSHQLIEVGTFDYATQQLTITNRAPLDAWLASAESAATSA